MTRRNRRRVTLTEPTAMGFRVTSVTLLGPSPDTVDQVRVRLSNGQVRVVSCGWLR